MTTTPYLTPMEQFSTTMEVSDRQNFVLRHKLGLADLLGRNWTVTLTQETVAQIAAKVEEYKAEHQGDYDKSDRLVATRLANAAAKSFADDYDRHVKNYNHRVESLRTTVAAGVPAPVETKVVWKANNGGTRIAGELHKANLPAMTYSYSIGSTVYIDSHFTDADNTFTHEYKVRLGMNDNGVFATLKAATEHATQLLAAEGAKYHQYLVDDYNEAVVALAKVDMTNDLLASITADAYAL